MAAVLLSRGTPLEFARDLQISLYSGFKHCLLVATSLSFLLVGHMATIYKVLGHFPEFCPQG